MKRGWPVKGLPFFIVSLMQNVPQVISFLKKIWPLLLLSGTMAYSHKAMFMETPGRLLYQVNFESNSLPSFLTTQTATPYAFQIVDNPVYQGSKAARFEFSEIGQTEVAKIQLNDVTAGILIEPGQNKQICHRFKTSQETTSQQPHGFVFESTP